MHARRRLVVDLDPRAWQVGLQESMTVICEFLYSNPNSCPLILEAD